MTQVPLRWRVRQTVLGLAHQGKTLGLRLVGRRLVRIDARLLTTTLRRLMGRRPAVLMVHSSLSHCGHICGAEATVIAALGGGYGTLCLPAHSYCYPASPAEPGPVFDPHTSESRVGRITNYFRRLPGVLRSIHPTHSLAVSGPLARELCAGHEGCDTPCGKGTPYEKLIARDAAVLMFGATMNAYTLFHTAEDAAGCPYLYEKPVYNLRARDYDGVLHQVPTYRQNMRVPRRFEQLDAVLEREGLLRRARLGVGQLLYVPSSRAAHAFLLGQMERDPYYLVHESYRRRRNHSCASAS